VAGRHDARDSRPPSTWNFSAWFVLAAQDFGKHRFAVRYDNFFTHVDHDYSPAPWSHNDGKAFTLGWTWSVREHVELDAEWLRVDSNYDVRAVLGEAPHAVEQSLQLAVRLSL
jgi:phosphate-selective porin